MFGISAEHILILVGILVVFGPKKLPQVGATLGKAVRNFKEHFNGIQEPEFRRVAPEKTSQKESGKTNA